MKLSNDVEKYEIDLAKMSQNYSFFCGALLAISYYRSLGII